MAGWETFFAALVSASATLAGLLFVGVSLNLTKILSNTGLPNRGQAGFFLFLGTLVIALLMLLPGQPERLAGLEVLIVGFLTWGRVTLLAVAGLRRVADDVRHYFIRHLVAFQLAALPYLIGGALLMAGFHSGLYWVAAATIFSLFTAAAEAWVLLVEINR